MPQIFVLPDHIASQIAAGEVVERPASVVKELVENSIDASASKIVIAVNEDCRYIRVADDGSGMEAADASLAFQRHATSKLKSADDLWNLQTLGFRGEALPSIASVSKLTCLTRTAESEIGTKVVNKDGTMTVSEAGCAKGTIIEVEDLFYNVPARLSFLKKPGTEFAHILDIVQSLAISRPNIAFELSLDGVFRFKTLGSNSLDSAIKESGFLNGQDNFIVLSGKDEILGLEIEGRLVSQKNFRGDRKGIMTLVNNRSVRCSLTYKALDYAYADLIPRGRYPLAVVHLKANPGEIDINIHPTKKEIRYSRGNEVYLFIQRQIVKALRNAEKIISPEVQEIAGDASKAINFEPLPESSLVRSKTPSSFTTTLFNTFDYAQDKVEQLSLKENGFTQSAPFSGMSRKTEFRDDFFTTATAAFSQNVPPHQTKSAPSLPLDWCVVGYLHNTYILLETKEGFSLVEQHIAHERVLYEKLLARQVTVEGQNLILSLPLQLTEEQKIVLEENTAALKEEGFEFEKVGENYNCLQVPIELAHKDYANIVQNILQELAESSKVNIRLDIVKSLACQSAVKNGMYLANEQIIELLNEWYITPRNETCPHGRPIQLSFSYEKLFQMFHPA